jgi:hypothetical protein
MPSPRIGENWREQLSALKYDWDSYDANPITTAALDAVDRILVIPMNSGGIQLEIHDIDLCITICIDPFGHVEDVNGSRV